MLLNLSIIHDALMQQWHPMQVQLDKMTPRRLKQLQFFSNGHTLSEEILYFCNAEDLPSVPVPDHPISLICTGFLPSSYAVASQCESLCFPANTDQRALFQSILDVFARFQAYDMKLKDMLIAGCPFSEFGQLALEIFETPAHAYGIFEKIIFMAYDETRLDSQELYHSYAEGYVPEDERSILYTDKEFMATFEETAPCYSCNDIYKTQIIFYNIFDDNNYIGRFLIENTYRPFRDSDYALTEWFGSYVKILLSQSRQFYFQTTREFEQMIQELALSDTAYIKEYDYALKSIGWGKHDTYLCIACTVTDTPSAKKILNDAAFYLQDLFDSQYIYLEQHFILQIINLSLSTLPHSEIIHRITIFLKNNALLAGTSSLYSEFEETSLHFQQARMMARFALRDRRKKLYEFDRNVLDLMLDQITQNGKVALFCNNHIQKLITYDAQNHTDLLKTLTVYMHHNQNVSRTSKELYIARTTCLYRLERIQEITHIHFDDPKENLYVRLILQMLSTSPS